MSDGIIIALITAGGALLLGLINLMINWGKETKKDKQKKKLDEEYKHQQLMNRLENIDGRLSTNAAGLQALLRYELYEVWGSCQSKGFANVLDRENFLNLYEKYHSMGSNGVMDHIKDSFLDLPLKKKTASKTKKLEEVTV